MSDQKWTAEEIEADAAELAASCGSSNPRTASMLRQQAATIAALQAEVERLQAGEFKQLRMDELDGVMHSVDKWLAHLPKSDERRHSNPATRAADAREIALQAIEEARSNRDHYKAAAERWAGMWQEFQAYIRNRNWVNAEWMLLEMQRIEQATAKETR